MDKKEYRIQRRRIARIILITLFITLLLVYINHNFFIKIDIRENKSIGNITSADEELNIVQSSGRNYHIIFDENDEYSIETKDSITRVMDFAKVPYLAYDIRDFEAIGQNDYAILILNNWEYFNEKIDALFDAVDNGTSVIITGILDFDETFIANIQKLGIEEFFGQKQTNSFVIKDDIMLGLIQGDSFESEMIADDIVDIQITDSARIYAEDASGIPIYYTVQCGEGKVGVFNGSNINERSFDGFILGMIGSLNGEFIYPIINAGVMFIDDWPGPFKGDYDIIYEQYGMSLDEFLKFVWWPDMVAFMKKYGVIYTGQYVNNYEDIVKAPFAIDKDEFDVAMFYYGQQMIKNGCEIGLHGYNHQPLWFSEYSSEELLEYKNWGNKEAALEAMAYGIDSFAQVFPEYKMNCYVPPSNVIDEQGIEIVKESLGSPVVIAGLYVGDPPETPQFEFEYRDDVIYFPRITFDSMLDNDTKISMASAMASYGVVSHFIHPDDVVDQERSRGLDWGSLRVEFEKILKFMEERYPYLEYMTATDAANNLIDWQNASYSIAYSDKTIIINRKDEAESLSFILRTDKEIVGGEGYTFQRAGDSSYCIKVTRKDVTINIGGGS